MTAEVVRFTDLATANRKGRELARAIEELERRRMEIQIKLAERLDARADSVAADRIDQAAQALLKRDASTVPDLGVSDFLTELNKIDLQLAALWKARTVVLAAQKRFAADKNNAAAAALQPEHSHAVRCIAAAAVALAAANAVETELRRQLPEGQHRTMPASFFPGIGQPTDVGSPIWTFLKWCRERGYVDAEFLKRAAE